MTRKRIECPSCGQGQICSEFQLADLLRAQGMLRREAEPDATTLIELLDAALPKMTCPQCQKEGLEVDAEFDESGGKFEEWGPQATDCEQCGQRIPPERLELYPQATRCAQCEAAPRERTEDDFCPRCGNILTMRTSGSGLTRYRSYCSECKR